MPPYESTALSSLRVKEQVEVRKALDLEIAIEMERRRRQRAEANGQHHIHKIEDNHRAFRSAYPLRKFIYETFPILEPGREYKNNWHIDAVSEMLEAATIGDLRKILINVPRRCMKSTLVSVMWFCWSWSFLPHTRWLFASFSEKFAYRDSNLCRKVIDSQYYQERFGNSFKKSLTTWKTSKFENTKGGLRACFGVGKGTGDGGDFDVVDDPHEIDEAESVKQIQKTVNWYFETFYNNVLDPQTVVRAIMHQRVGEEDLTGETLAREMGYEHLCLPMKFEDDHPHKNSVSKPLKLGIVSQFDKAQDASLVVGQEKLWVDPRDLQAPAFDNAWYRKWYKDSFESLGQKSEGENQLLWVNRFRQQDIDDMVRALQAYGESAQLQQRPIRRGGNFFQSALFREISLAELDFNGMSFFRYWDKAGTDPAKEKVKKADWTVGMLIGRTVKRPYNLIILDIFREQIGLYARMDKIKELAEQDTRDFVEKYEDTEYTVAIEREPASAGKDISIIERDHLQGYNVVLDQPRGKKSHRAKIAKSLSEGGRIFMLAGTLWRSPFIKEIEKFDPEKDAQVDDQVDTLSGGCKLAIFGAPDQGAGSVGGLV